MKGDLPDFLDGGSSHLGPRPPQRGPAAWWWIGGGALIVVAGALVALYLAGYIPLRRAHGAKGTPSVHRPAPSGPGSTATRTPPPWRGPVPYPVLIADTGHHRLLEVTPTGKVVWQLSLPAAGGVVVHPNDVAFSPHGHSVLVSAETQDLVERVDYATRQVRWTFGVPGQAGAGSQHLNYPDDPAMLPNGDIAVADIRNCREVILSGTGQMLAAWGKPQLNYCQTNPSQGLFGYPNGSQPQPDGNILLTFSSGDRIAMFSPSGKVLWNVSAPDLFGGFASDAVAGTAGTVIVCGYGTPGSVAAFNPHSGAQLWHYFVASGPNALSNPTVALPLPGGNVLVADSGNNRVVAINPSTGRIVWTYATGLSHPGGVALDVYRNWQVPAPRGARAAHPRVGARGARPVSRRKAAA